MAKKQSGSRTARSAERVDFEQAIEEVEQIVIQLESGELGLTESLNQYETGIKRLKQCHGLLDAAEQRVSMLSGFDAEGNPLAAPFEGKSGAGPRPEFKAEESGDGQDDEQPDRVDDSPGLF